MLVCVDRIVAERDFGMIFSATLDGGQRVRVRARFADIAGTPAPGETWDVDGEIAQTEWGPQVTARRAVRAPARGVLVRKFLAGSVPGVGERRAERLWHAFGEALAGMLADPASAGPIAEAIAPEHPLLGVRLAAACIAGWKDAEGEASLVAWLDSHGVEEIALARRLFRIFGEGAMDRLADNPYALVPLLPWSKVDALGSKLLPKHATDVRRQVGAADEVVKQALRRGDTAMWEEAFRSKLADLLRPAVDGLEEVVAAVLRNGCVSPRDSLWRAPGAAAMEEAVVDRLLDLASTASSGPVRVPGRPSRLAELAAEVAQPGRPLHPEQAVAAMTVLRRGVACLSGGAGTGKTYTCRVICDAWERLGGQVLLCALAGKAALRLSRSTGRLARTLARTLAELDERERRLEGADPFAPPDPKLAELASISERTLVLVDEASMVDLPTMHALLRRVPSGARLLMVGDDAQLPPVGFGLVFHRLVVDPAISIRLTHVHRHAAETGIPGVAAVLRRREAPALPNYGGLSDGVSLVVSSLESLDQRIERIAVDLGILEGGALIVTATNDGACGVHSLNARLHAVHVETTGADVLKGVLGTSYAVGEPVIFGRNDYRLGLFNGLMGRVVSVHPDEGALEVAFEGAGVHRIGAENLIDLDLAYAVTCHKCQGSSVPRVIVPLYRTRVMDPSWLYTAVTRAERQVVLAGDPEVLADALRRPFAAESRTVGFRWPGAA